MEITTKIGTGKTIHAASYDKEINKLSLYCDSLKYEQILFELIDEIPPTIYTVTCKKCLKKLKEQHILF